MSYCLRALGTVVKFNTQDASRYSVIHTEMFSATVKFSVKSTVYCSM